MNNYLNAMIDITPGVLLIADPFLKDPNFMRSVVLICDHNEDGSLGFVINKSFGQPVSNLLSNLEFCDFPVFYGGPVQRDTVHFIHHCPHLVEGGIQVGRNMYWGGDFNMAVNGIAQGIITREMLRFYIGYSGWGQGQLEEELKTKSWITSLATLPLVFHNHTTEVWKDALKQLGGEYEIMVNYPSDPQLN
jgi:putative transcriptional regulator